MRETTPMSRPLAVSAVSVVPNEHLSLGPKPSSASVDSLAGNSDFSLCSEGADDQLFAESLQSLSRSHNSRSLPPLRGSGSGNASPRSSPQVLTRATAKAKHDAPLRVLAQKEFFIDSAADKARRQSNERSRRFLNDDFEESLAVPLSTTLSKISLSMSEDSGVIVEQPSLLSFKPLRGNALSRNPTKSFQSHFPSNTVASKSYDYPISKNPSWYSDKQENTISVPIPKVQQASEVSTNSGYFLEFSDCLEKIDQEPIPITDESLFSMAVDNPGNFGDPEAEQQSLQYAYMPPPAEHVGNLDPVPYQVHNRILGWKLTSVKRRQDLIDILDIIHDPDDPRLRLNMKRMNKSTRKKLLQADSSHSTADSYSEHQHLSERQRNSVEQYLSRSLKSRQSFKNIATIKSLMDDKRKALKSRDDAIKSGDISTDIGSSVLKRMRSPQLMSSNDKLGVKVSLSDFQSLFSPEDDIEPTASFDQSGTTVQRSQSPLQKLYDFPINIHKPRDRMDIIESVRFRESLEDSVLQQRLKSDV